MSEQSHLNPLNNAAVSWLTGRENKTPNDFIFPYIFLCIFIFPTSLFHCFHHHFLWLKCQFAQKLSLRSFSSSEWYLSSGFAIKQTCDINEHSSALWLCCRDIYQWMPISSAHTHTLPPKSRLPLASYPHACTYRLSTNQYIFQIQFVVVLNFTLFLSASFVCRQHPISEWVL